MVTIRVQVLRGEQLLTETEFIAAAGNHKFICSDEHRIVDPDCGIYLNGYEVIANISPLINDMHKGTSK